MAVDPALRSVRGSEAPRRQNPVTAEAVASKRQWFRNAGTKTHSLTHRLKACATRNRLKPVLLGGEVAELARAAHEIERDSSIGLRCAAAGVRFGALRHFHRRQLPARAAQLKAS